MEQLKELLTSSDWAAKRAQIAIKITETPANRYIILLTSLHFVKFNFSDNLILNVFRTALNATNNTSAFITI